MTTTEVIEVSGDIEKYTTLLDTYGAAVVILAVFIFAFMVVFAFLLRNNSKTTKQIMDQQQILLNKIIENEKDGDDEDDLKEKNLVELFVNIDNSTKDVLKKINHEIDASRLSIYVFHNGSYSSHGLPFFKVSCISEIIKKNCGIVTRIKEHTNLPLSMFNTSIEELFNNGKVVIEDVASIENEYPVLFNILNNSSIKSGCGIAIYDHDNNILGVIIAEFKEKKDNLDKEVNTLIEYCTFLEPILTYSKKN